MPERFAEAVDYVTNLHGIPNNMQQSNVYIPKNVKDKDEMDFENDDKAGYEEE